MKTINLVGGRKATAAPTALNTEPGVLETDFHILEPVSGPGSILAVTVDGAPAALDATTPMPDATTVRLAAAPPVGSKVTISYKSAAVDHVF